MEYSILYLIDEKTFPGGSHGLTEALNIMREGETKTINAKDPLVYWTALQGAMEEYDIVIPLTRNDFILRKAKQAGCPLVFKII